MSQKAVENPFEQWERVRCPICMDHPHQAILLLCSSHEEGCRPYICDTGPNHSNCFSQLTNSSTRLMCPLCRGKVRDWTVDAGAQHFMNRKPRTCANAACNFSGTYMDLEDHVRLVHPVAADPNAAGPSGSVGPVMDQDLRDLGYLLSQLEMNHRELYGKIEQLVTGSR